MILIKNVTCINGDGILENASVLIDGEKILDVQPADKLPLPAGECTVIDGKGRYLVPGYIDLHIHGFGGCTFMDGSPDTVDSALRLLAEHGTTSCLVTTSCENTDTIQRAIAAAKESSTRKVGTNVLGIHLEGPFINPERGGANKVEHMMPPTVSDYEAITAGFEPFIKRITLAPEYEHGLELTRYLAQRGVCVSVGHSVATAEVMEQFAEAGGTLCTHFFNGMEPMHHRFPGVVGSGLLDDRLSAELICDLVHVDGAMIKLVHKVKGPDRCLIVTDNITSSGLRDGTYFFDDEEITVKDRMCRDAAGALAGSWQPMDVQIRNLVNELGFDLCDVVKMSSVNPAKLIGFGSCKGRIEKGYDADLNILDKDLNVVENIIGGRLFSYT